MIKRKYILTFINNQLNTENVATDSNVSTILDFDSEKTRNDYIQENLFKTNKNWLDLLNEQKSKSWNVIDDINVTFTIGVKEYKEQFNLDLPDEEIRNLLLNKNYVFMQENNQRAEGYFISVLASDQGIITYNGTWDISMNTILNDTFNPNKTANITRAHLPETKDNLPNIHVDSLSSLPEDIEGSIGENSRYDILVRELGKYFDDDDFASSGFSFETNFDLGMSKDEQVKIIKNMLKTGFTVYYLKQDNSSFNVGYPAKNNAFSASNLEQVYSKNWMSVPEDIFAISSDYASKLSKIIDISAFSNSFNYFKENPLLTLLSSGYFGVSRRKEKWPTWVGNNIKDDVDTIANLFYYEGMKTNDINSYINVIAVPNFSWFFSDLSNLNNDLNLDLETLYFTGVNSIIGGDSPGQATLKFVAPSFFSQKDTDPLFSSTSVLISKTIMPFSFFSQKSTDIYRFKLYKDIDKAGNQIEGWRLGVFIKSEDKTPAFGLNNDFTFSLLQMVDKNDGSYNGVARNYNRMYGWVENSNAEQIKAFMPIVLSKQILNDNVPEYKVKDIYKNYHYDKDINKSFIPNNIAKLYKSPYTTYKISSIESNEYEIKPELIYDEFSLLAHYTFNPSIFHTVLKPKTIRDTLYNSDLALGYYFQDLGDNTLYQSSSEYIEYMMRNRESYNLDVKLAKRNQALGIFGGAVNIGQSMTPNAYFSRNTNNGGVNNYSTLGMSSAQIGGIFSGISQMIRAGDQVKQLSAQMQDLKNIPNKVFGNAGDYFWSISQNIKYYSVKKSVLYKPIHDKIAQYFHMFGYNLSSINLKLTDYLHTKYWFNYIQAELTQDNFKDKIGANKMQLYKDILSTGVWIRHIHSSTDDPKNFNVNNVDLELL